MGVTREVQGARSASWISSGAWASRGPAGGSAVKSETCSG
jgi:hypothetical protein